MIYKSMLVVVILGVAVFLLTENLYSLRLRLSELRFKKYEGRQDDQGDKNEQAFDPITEPKTSS